MPGVTQPIPVIADPNCPPGEAYLFSSGSYFGNLVTTAPGWNARINFDGETSVFEVASAACTRFVSNLRTLEVLNLNHEIPNQRLSWPDDDHIWAFETERDGLRVALTITLHAEWELRKRVNYKGEPEEYKHVLSQDCEIYRYDNECGLDGARLVTDSEGLHILIHEATQWFYTRWLERRAA